MDELERWKKIRKKVKFIDSLRDLKNKIEVALQSKGTSTMVIGRERSRKVPKDPQKVPKGPKRSQKVP